MQKSGLFCVVSAITVLIAFSCGDNRYKVNTTGIKAEVSIKRLEQDLFRPGEAAFKESLPELKAKYDGFLQLFSLVINAGDIDDPAWPDYISSFSNDKTNFEVYNETLELYDDIKPLESGLTEAVKRYIHYMPGRTIPYFYTCITGFNNSIIVGDSVIGIGLDMYMGSDSRYYPMLGYYSYQFSRMTPENIIPDCIYAWVSTEWSFGDLGYGTDNTLSEMIHEGKLKYLEKCILPSTEDNLLFGFTESQMEFCINNEGLMWQYLIENDLLFSTDQFTIRKLMGEAPFTSYFSNQSPGKSGMWLGFRIVESYMNKHPETGLEELMKDADFQKILEESKYSPGR